MELDDIKALLGFPIYYRARQYYDEGRVEKITIFSDEIITAQVRGSDSKSYSVNINLITHQLRCTCPYPDICKHIGALLLSLYYQNDKCLLKLNITAPDMYDKAIEEIKTRISQSQDIIIPIRHDLRISELAQNAVPEKIDVSYQKHSVDVHRKQYRLIFLIEDTGFYHDCILIPALQYLKRTGEEGRIENYSPGKITEPAPPSSEKLLKNLLADRKVYGPGRNMLITYLAYIVEHDEVPVFCRTQYAQSPVKKEKIENLTIHFEVNNMDGTNPIFTPLFSINGHKPLFIDEISMNATGNSAYIFDLAGHLFYTLNDVDIAFIIKHFHHKSTNWNLNDIKHCYKICSEMNNPAISVEFSRKEIRVVHPLPVPVIVLEPAVYSLSLSLFFSYSGHEKPYGNLKEYVIIPPEKPEEFLVAKRNFAFEDMFYKKFLTLISKARGLYLVDIRGFGFHDKGPSISIEMSIPQFLTHFGKKLSDAGVEFKIHNSQARFSITMGRMFLSIKSGIAWFEVDPKYREDEKEFDIRINPEYLKDGLVQVGESYKILSAEEIEILSKLVEHGLKDGKSAKVNKKDLGAVNDIIQLAGNENLAGDVDEAARVNEIFLRLQNFSSFNEHSLPTEFRGTLRPYQMTGYQWLRFLHEYEIGGCLADDMGLGKTIQTLTLLQSLKEAGSLRTSLIVLPVTTMANWMNEVERFTPALSALPHRGSSRDRQGTSFHHYDLVLTSYQTLQRDITMFSSFEFFYVILDESQYIKNANSKTFNCVRKLKSAHRLSLSGTPIENNTFELWAQMEFLNPGILGNIQHFRQYYTNPIEKYGDDEAVKKLRKKVYPFILRRKKEDVAQDLPPKEVITVYLDMTDKQRELYETWRKHFNQEIEEALLNQTPEQATMTILTSLLRLRQICIFPELFSKEYASIGSGKFDYLKDTIEELLFEDHKVICFSQFVKALSIIRKHFDDKKIRYSYIDGQTGNREDQIEAFQKSNSVPLFLISLKAGGLGINLTAADYVIIFDPWWNPAVENQAIDRAHRIGRKNKVIAYRLIMKNSIEEKIEQLQNKKRKLASDLITDDSSFLKSLSRDDLMELFS